MRTAHRDGKRNSPSEWFPRTRNVCVQYRLITAAGGCQFFFVFIHFFPLRNFKALTLFQMAESMYAALRRRRFSPSRNPHNDTHYKVNTVRTYIQNKEYIFYIVNIQRRPHWYGVAACVRSGRARALAPRTAM